MNETAYATAQGTAFASHVDSTTAIIDAIRAYKSAHSEPEEQAFALSLALEDGVYTAGIAFTERTGDMTVMYWKDTYPEAISKLWAEDYSLVSELDTIMHENDWLDGQDGVDCGPEQPED